MRAKKTKHEVGQAQEENSNEEGNVSYLSQKFQFNGSSRSGQGAGDWQAKNEKIACRNIRNGTA